MLSKKSEEIEYLF